MCFKVLYQTSSPNHPYWSWTWNSPYIWWRAKPAILCQQPSSACQLPSASLLTCSSSSSILCSHTSGPFHFPFFLLFQFQSLRLVCSSPLWGDGCGDSGPQLWQILSQQQLCALGAPGPDFRIFPEPTFFFLNSASPYLAPSHCQHEDHMCIVSWTGKSCWGSAGPFSGWSFFPHLYEISPFCIVFTLRLKLYVVLLSCSILDVKTSGLFKYAYGNPFCV